MRVFVHAFMRNAAVYSGGMGVVPGESAPAPGTEDEVAAVSELELDEFFRLGAGEPGVLLGMPRARRAAERDFLRQRPGITRSMLMLALVTRANDHLEELLRTARGGGGGGGGVQYADKQHDLSLIGMQIKAEPASPHEQLQDDVMVMAAMDQLTGFSSAGPDDPAVDVHVAVLWRLLPVERFGPCARTSVRLRLSLTRLCDRGRLIADCDFVHFYLCPIGMPVIQ